MKVKNKSKRKDGNTQNNLKRKANEKQIGKNLDNANKCVRKDDLSEDKR